ncbi:hypothetical protein F2Q70_00015678 [Brassica cretica]|uniref:Uncharacterized protein n=1 Tax=Brassica cretica TaxID=69181 RepID=A0A8S9I1J9_BRACR|nr:hypothetical protein F2Q70_00015678 [Brassica cretica]
MVARTTCEDSVLNHRSKLSWMKRQSTNCPRTSRHRHHHKRTTMDETSQSNHHGGHVFAVLLQSMCRWNGGVGASSRLLPRSKLDCRDFTGVLRLEHMSCAELVV